MSKCCNERPIVGPIVPFNFWTAFTPVVPDVYKDAISPQQQIHDMCCMLHKLVCYSDMLASELNIDKDKLQELSDMFDRFQESGFEAYYAEQIHAWVLENMPDIIRDAIRMVFFGLTADGYFCAWIPDSWTDIWFDTGANYNRSDYGHLMILFDAEGAGDYSYVSDFDTLEQMIHDGDEALSNRLDRTEQTLYTDVSEGGE